RGGERHRDELHLGLLRGSRGFLIVAAAAGRDHVHPGIRSALTERADMIARELTRRKPQPAVHAQIPIAPKESLIVERRNIVMAGVAGVTGVPHRGHDGIDLEHGAMTGARVRTTIELIKERAAGVSHLLLMVKARRLLVVDPLKWHTAHIRPQ